MAVPPDNTGRFKLPSNLARPLPVQGLESDGSWGATVSKSSGAGFYSHTWGPVPFVLGPTTHGAYQVFEARMRILLK